MGINRWKDRHGRERIVVSKYWPDKSRTRLYCRNMTLAKKLMARIDESVVMGTWRKLKEELTGPWQDANPTIEEFAEIYLTEYCRTRNTRPDFKQQALTSIVRILGQVRLKDLRRPHAYQFITTRSKEVAPATVNRGLAVLKNMLSFAFEKELLDAHPLVRFRMLPEDEKALRVPSLEEERRLVESVAEVDPVIGAYAALLGETGLRKSEGLNLKWEHVNRQQRLVAVEKTKSRKARYVPLSDFALNWLDASPAHRMPLRLHSTGSKEAVERCPWSFREGKEGGWPGLGRLSRLTPLSSDSVGSTGRRSSHGSGTAGSQRYPHDDALRPLRSQPCRGQRRRSAAKRGHRGRDPRFLQATNRQQVI